MRARILFLLLLACVVFARSIERFSRSAGVDFYHYWAVSKAQQWSEVALGSPYTDQARYAEALNAHADGSQDERLKAANRYRRTLDLTGTPLFYAAFGFFPADYSLAFALFQAIQVLLFIASILTLGWLYGGDRLWGSLFALLLAALYEPLASDLRVGNVNSIQLFAITLLAVLADRMLVDRAAGERLRRGAVFLCALAVLTLLKPNLALVAALLAAHLWARQGTRAFAPAAVAAAALCLALAALPCFSFHSWTVWQDWQRAVFGADRAKLVYPIAEGNYATVLVVSEALGVGRFSVLASLAAVLALSLVGALWRADSGARSGLRGVWRAAVRSIWDPHLAAAVAIVATLALAPLLWLHYYTLSLLPALWLLWSGHRWAQADTMGALSVLLTSGALFPIFRWLGWGEVVPYGYAISWVPLWIGVVAEMALRREADTRAEASIC